MRFVRETRRLSIDQVAVELKIKPERLVRFESGELTPTMGQFEALQAMYGVPDYVLASNETPEMRPVVVDLRAAEATPLKISPKGWKAYFAKAASAELIDSIAESLQINPGRPRPKGFNKENIADRDAEIRKLLDFDPFDARWIANPDLALRYLRAKIEDFGVYCFMAEAPPEDFRGLFDRLSDRASLIIINKRTFKTKARLFTLAHEFAHFLITLEGVSDPGRIDHAAERACNRFASNFLAPPDGFRDLLAHGKLSSRTVSGWISYISRRCLLSQGAVAYRLREDGAVDDKDYRAWYRANGLPPGYSGASTPEELAEGETGSGGNWAYNVVSDMGFRPIEIIRRALKQLAIDDVHVAQILNARGATQEKVFKTATDRLAELGL